MIIIIKKVDDNKRKRGILNDDDHDDSNNPQLSGMTEYSAHPQTTNYSLDPATIDPLKKVVIIVHGWSIMNEQVEETYMGVERQTVKMPEWVFLLQNRILEADDVNVVVHDWRGGAYHGYAQSRYNTWTAGYDLAMFIKSLLALGVVPKNVHLIGHSLGCHVASLAAKQVGQIGRISAMDPARPLYDGDDEKLSQLSKSDASLVDVYHTDGSSLTVKAAGINEPVGHVDFYPNNGTDQPHCHGDNLNAMEASVCDHIAAYMYFIKSTTSKQFALRCRSYEDYQSGKCVSCRSGRCLRVGYFVDQTSKRPLSRKKGPIRKRHYGKYYYQTAQPEKDSDYCAKPVMVEVQLGKRQLTEVKRKHKFGRGSKLSFEIITNTGNTIVQRHPVDLDQLVAGLDKTNFEQRKSVKFVFGLPCTESVFPAAQLTVKVATQCTQTRSFLSRFIGGSCGTSELHLRRARLVEVGPIAKVQRMRPVHHGSDGAVILVEATEN